MAIKSCISNQCKSEKKTKSGLHKIPTSTDIDDNTDAIIGFDESNNLADQKAFYSSDSEAEFSVELELELEAEVEAEAEVNDK